MLQEGEGEDLTQNRMQPGIHLSSGDYDQKEPGNSDRALKFIRFAVRNNGLAVIPCYVRGVKPDIGFK
jgi:hypothetical protein